MGILSGMQALKAKAKIEAGGIAKLSVAQIASMNVNMLDAKKNLTNEQFQKVYSVYQACKKDTKKRLYDFDGYFDITIKTIKRFNDVAPYLKYSGGDGLNDALLLRAVEQYEKGLSVEP